MAVGSGLRGAAEGELVAIGKHRGRRGEILSLRRTQMNNAGRADQGGFVLRSFASPARELPEIVDFFPVS